MLNRISVKYILTSFGVLFFLLSFSDVYAKGRRPGFGAPTSSWNNRHDYDGPDERIADLLIAEAQRRASHGVILGEQKTTIGSVFYCTATGAAVTSTGSKTIDSDIEAENSGDVSATCNDGGPGNDTFRTPTTSPNPHSNGGKKPY